MKRHVLATTGAVALLAAPVALAVPSIDSGKYKGKTTKGGATLAFKVTSSKRLTHFNFKGLKLKCDDGDTVRIKDKLDSGPKRLTITDTGKFAFTVTYTNGGKWTARGKIKGNKATGTLRMQVRFNDTKPDPKGSILCDSGKRKFKARHKRS
jgi:opacity protein-like surface antigen